MHLEINSWEIYATRGPIWTLWIARGTPQWHLGSPFYLHDRDGTIVLGVRGWLHVDFTWRAHSPSYLFSDPDDYRHGDLLNRTPQKWWEWPKYSARGGVAVGAPGDD